MQGEVKVEETDIVQRAAKEEKRLKKLLKDADLSKARQDALITVVQNVAWMKIKLDDARAAIKTAQIAIKYDNGGGQTGLRENPLFKGYESLWKSYIAGVDRILAALPAEAVKEPIIEEEAAPKTVLSLVRARHKEA